MKAKYNINFETRLTHQNVDLIAAMLHLLLDGKYYTITYKVKDKLGKILRFVPRNVYYSKSKRIYRIDEKSGIIGDGNVINIHHKHEQHFGFQDDILIPIGNLKFWTCLVYTTRDGFSINDLSPHFYFKGNSIIIKNPKMPRNNQYAEYLITIHQKEPLGKKSSKSKNKSRVTK